MNEEAVIGQYLREYESPRLNINRVLNDLFASAPVPFTQTAVIVQQKKVPDVSFYQGVIDWIRMRSQTDAVIIRAGQHLNPDSQFANNWARARAQGMARGLYWFFDDRADPGRQADLLVSLIRNDLPEMEIWIDWEVVYGGAFGGLRNVVAMMQRIEQLLPSVTVGIYSGFYFFRDHSNAVANVAQYSYLRSRPLWLGWYTANAANVLIPTPWSELLFWQFGTPSVGHDYGVASLKIDMSYFNGTQDAFDFRYGGIVEEPMTKYGTVNVPGLNIRNGAGTPFTDIGDLTTGDELISDRQQMVGTIEWWHLVDAKHNGTPVLTTNGQPVAERTDCWASGYYVTEHAAPGPTVHKTHTVDVYSDGSLIIDGHAYP